MFLFKEPITDNSKLAHFKNPFFSSLDLIRMFQLMNTLGQKGLKSVMGGGFIRDSFLSKPIKDIDLFIQQKEDESIEETLITLRSLGLDLKVDVPDFVVNYIDSIKDILCVLSTTLPNTSAPTQLIILKNSLDTPEQVIERLDFGVCQIGMDYMGNVWFTEAFLQDTLYNQMTLIRANSEADYKRSVSRYQRLSSEKFIGWPLKEGFKKTW